MSKYKFITVEGIDGSGKSIFIPLMVEMLKEAGEDVLLTRERVVDVVKPALDSGKFVISDRFVDSAYAYQGGGKGVPKEYLEMLEKMTVEGIEPDLTFLFIVTPEISKQRMNSSRDNLDKFEREGGGFFQKALDAYMERVKENPGRFIIIDSTLTMEDTKRQIITHMTKYIANMKAQVENKVRKKM